MTGDAANTDNLFDRLLDRLVPLRVERRRLAARAARLENFAATLPLDYAGWDKTGAATQSAGFAALLGLDAVRKPDDIGRALTPGDAAALETLYTRLSEKGDGFEISLMLVTNKKTLKIYGRAEDGLAVLYALDVSDYAEAARHGFENAARIERKEAELRAALNNLPLPVWLRDRNLNINWCNKAYARTVDDTAAAVIAEQKEIALTGAARGDMTMRALSQRALATGTAQRLRGHTVIDGQRRLIELVEAPLPQEERTVGLVLDVTREEEWAASYERLAASHREAMEQLRTAIAMFDAETRLEFYNAAYEQLTGLSPSWLDTRPKFVDVIDKLRENRRLPDQADYKQFKQQWLGRFTALMEPYEEMQYLPDGTIMRIIAVARPMGGLLLTQEDVTSRLQLETSYNTLMAVQQETMNNLSAGIAVFGEDGRLKLYNQSFARLWHLNTAEMKGEPHISALLDHTPLLKEDAAADMRATMLANALEREERRGQITQADGRVLEYASLPLPDGNILNTYADVTDTAMVERALREKNAALEEADRLKADFLANVSYQLRTPLNAMLGFAEMLNQQYPGQLNDRQLEYTGAMLDAGRRLVSLVNDILDLSAIEAGHMELSATRFMLRPLIAQVAELTGNWAQKQKISLAIRCADDLAVTADARRIKQVLLNLISNAINHSPPGSTITIAAAERQGMIELSVADTGSGIAAEDLARIFTPFERIRDGKTGRRAGAGLGLTLVKSIVDLHGGTVTIDSAPGDGTTVTCRLPA